MMTTQIDVTGLGNRLSQIAESLGHAYIEQASGRNRLEYLERSLTTAIQTIMPPEGWPGKNAEQREAARLAAIQGNRVIAECEEAITSAKIGSNNIAAEIAELEAERRAIEWRCRLALAQVIGGKDYELLL